DGGRRAEAGARDGGPCGRRQRPGGDRGRPRGTRRVVDRVRHPWLGRHPTNMLPLAETLERERPDLTGHRYGIVALGDRTYQDTFCGGAKKVDRVFALCGARRIGDRLEVDAASPPLPDPEALSWGESGNSLRRHPARFGRGG